MDNLLVGSISDGSLSTGSTVFFFPQGAGASFDSRGGSVASVETTLLAEGSYTNVIDAVIFSGGSTMGLAAADGVREVIYKSRSQGASAFDAIPSVPGAVVYDFGGRPYRGQRQLVYPSKEMGRKLMEHLSSSEFILGKAGAGTSTTANKVGDLIWGGQGAAFIEMPWGKVFVAVILNPVGNVSVNGIPSIREHREFEPVSPGKNTTLSIVVTDVALDRNQLKRLATMVHTSMARMIHPFHTYSDGDIQFAVSNGDRPIPVMENRDFEFELSVVASDLMAKAIQRAATTANGVKGD